MQYYCYYIISNLFYLIKYLLSIFIQFESFNIIINIFLFSNYYLIKIPCIFIFPSIFGTFAGDDPKCVSSQRAYALFFISEIKSYINYIQIAHIFWQTPLCTNLFFTIKHIIIIVKLLIIIFWKKFDLDFTHNHVDVLIKSTQFLYF